MIKINLVPADILAKAHNQQKALQLGLAGGAVGALIVVVSMGFVFRLASLERKLADHQAEFKRLSAVVDKVKEAETAANLLKARLKVIDDLDRGRRAYPYFMSDFVRSVPPGVRVKSLRTVGGNNNPIKLDMSAEARSNADIASWVAKMEESGRFSAVELGAVTTTETPEGVLWNFTLTTVYSPQL
ncbi:MAG: PilN domain-containing protein [Elusimicrobiota bacterium]|jgi:Tfp pilus assembly protein PilN